MFKKHPNEQQTSKGIIHPVMNVAGLLERRDIGWFALMIVALLASAGITLGFGYILKNLVDQGFSAENSEHLNAMLGVMLAMIFGLALASFARLTMAGYLSENLVARLRTRTYRHLLTLDSAFYGRQNSAEIASNLSADTTMIGSVMATALPLVVRNILMVVGGIVMLVITSPALTLLVLVVMPLIALPIIVIGRLSRRNAKRTEEEVGALGGQMSETISAIQTVQSFTSEDVFAHSFDGRARGALKAAMRHTMSRSTMSSVIILILFSSICVVLWYGARDVIAGDMSAGALTSFVFYAAIVASAFGILGDVGASVFRAAQGLERIRAILRIQPTIQNPENIPSNLPDRATGFLSIENVTFKYDASASFPVLDGLTLSAQPGQTIAIVGTSGAGKTTLFQLLMRFFDPLTGAITLDGHDLRSWPLNRLRAQMAYVPQDAALFSGSVRDNIMMGAFEASDDDMIAASRAAQAHDFIVGMPNGYDTIIGERGLGLSGGQKQRIALSRALLKDAPVLLLDEATSSLDSENENAIRTALQGLHGTRTMIVIAHRLSTIMEADKIYVMHAGRVIEEGAHNELVTHGGAYARMVEQQFNVTEGNLRKDRPSLPNSLH